jgi:bisphosphoglycerate-independent phosphoglycerate mutase (AlkP superfamily)
MKNDNFNEPKILKTHSTIKNTDLLIKNNYRNDIRKHAIQLDLSQTKISSSSFIDSNSKSRPQPQII